MRFVLASKIDIMIQVILKNSAGVITQVMNCVEDLAVALNDPMIKTQCTIGDLFSYVMRNHYRTKINGIDYYHSNASFGIGQPTTLVFTELELPGSRKDLKLVLEDKNEIVIEEKDVTLAQFADLLNDTQITQCADAAVLAIYLLNHHFQITINGDSYQLRGNTIGVNQLPTFTFFKL